MAPTPTLQSFLGDSVKDDAASDLQPLVANDTYRNAVNAELAVLDAAEKAATAAAARQEDLRGVVQMFAQATRSLRAIAKRFPETSAPIAEAVKQTQLAMGLAVNNPPKPQPPVPPAPPVPKPPVPQPAPPAPVPPVTPIAK